MHDDPPSGDLNPGDVSVSGQRETANGFGVNGGSVEEDFNNIASVVPNLVSITEIRVLTSNFNAEYGNFSGGQVLVVTKTGTNDLHGSAFEFFPIRISMLRITLRVIELPMTGTSLEERWGGACSVTGCFISAITRERG